MRPETGTIPRISMFLYCLWQARGAGARKITHLRLVLQIRNVEIFALSAHILAFYLFRLLFLPEIEIIILLGITNHR